MHRGRPTRRRLRVVSGEWRFLGRRDRVLSIAGSWKPRFVAVRCLTCVPADRDRGVGSGRAGWGARTRRHRAERAFTGAWKLGVPRGERGHWTWWRGPIWASRRMWHLASGVRIGDAACSCSYVFPLGATGEDSGETGVGLGRVCTRTSDIMRHRPHERWTCQCGIGTRWSKLSLVQSLNRINHTHARTVYVPGKYVCTRPRRWEGNPGGWRLASGGSCFSCLEA